MRRASALSVLVHPVTRSAMRKPKLRIRSPISSQRLARLYSRTSAVADCRLASVMVMAPTHVLVFEDQMMTGFGGDLHGLRLLGERGCGQKQQSQSMGLSHKERL